MKTERIAQIIAQCDGSSKSVQEAANAILMEDTDISVGATVAIVDPEQYGGLVGKGKVKSFSEDKQYANVTFDDGREVPILTNSLYLVDKG
jgi:hypothetical protein